MTSFGKQDLGRGSVGSRGTTRVAVAGVVAMTVLSGCTTQAAPDGTPPSSASVVPAAGATPARPAPSSAPVGSATARGSGADATSSEWTTYRNEKFGFSVQVPASLVAGPSPTGGEGLTYRSADGRTEVTASASATPAGATPATEAADHTADLRRRGEVTTTTVDASANSYTVSGFLHGGTLVEYVRGVVGPHTEYLLSWSYPTAERTTADPWVEHSVATFQPGPL